MKVEDAGVAVHLDGVDGELADAEGAANAVREFLTTPIEWYMHLALATSEHGRVSLSRIRVPAAFVAGRWDVLAGARDMATAAERIPDATYAELRASHFVPLEQPAVVLERLHVLLDRVAAQAQAESA